MKTLCDLFNSYVTRFNRPDALTYQGKGGQLYQISTNEFKDRVLHFAIGLKKMGLKPERKLALISENRPEWQVIDFACQLLGVIVIPINPTCSLQDLASIIADGEPECVIMSEHVQAKLHDVESLAKVNTVIGLDVSSPQEHRSSFEEILRIGREGNYTEFFRSAIEARQPDSVATIVYVPDSSGKLRGVMLSHANLVTITRSCSDVLEINALDKVFCAGSFADPFLRISSYMSFLQGSGLVYASADSLAEIVKSSSPTVLSADPQFYRDLTAQIERVTKQTGILRRLVARWGLGVAKKRVRRDLARAQARPFKSPYRLLARMVLSNVLPSAKPVPRLLLSGGRLSPEQSHFLRLLGLTVLESFGPSESSSLLTINPPTRPKPGTAGLPLPGISIKLSDDGEVLARGENIMVGYYSNQEQTKEAVVDG
ncbi:AMP-binding protein [bacterium]|nr:AMP-binding protein [bacterium]